MIRRSCPLLVLLCVPSALLLVACGGGPQDGERRVEVLSEAVHVVGTSDAIARITDLQSAADGRIWVLNSIGVEPFFVALGPDGRVEREFGLSGGGPAEFGAPVALVRGPTGEVWTYDLTRHALIRISTQERGVICAFRAIRSPPRSSSRSQVPEPSRRVRG